MLPRIFPIGRFIQLSVCTAIPFQDTFLDPFILATDPKIATAEIEIVLILYILANFKLTSIIIMYVLMFSVHFGLFW